MQGSQENMITTVIKGICVGGTMLVPGCSGGSMAMILGIYDRLVSSVSSFMILKKAQWERKGFGKILFFLLGAGVVGVFALLPSDTFQADMNAGLTSYLMLILAGVIAAVALVLPGISVSYMLLLMGMYDTVMKAITQLHLPYLIPVGLGLAIGVIVSTRLLECAMARFPGPAYLCILGFMAASMAQVFPGLPGGREWLTCLLMLAAGFLIIYFISEKEIRGSVQTASR